MSKDMLGSILRASVKISEKHHGLLLDVANKLGSEAADDVHERIKQALREGRATKAQPASTQEPVPDSAVRVDRSVRPVYPDWADEKSINDPKFLALERIGPSEYGLGTLDPWLHDRQKNGGWCKGQVIFDHLAANDMLESCLGLVDLLAIQKLGIETFRKHFAGKAVFGWKSVVRHRLGALDALYLVGRDGRVKLYWRWLAFDWYGYNPALRFAS